MPAFTRTEQVYGGIHFRSVAKEWLKKLGFPNVDPSANGIVQDGALRTALLDVGLEDTHNIEHCQALREWTAFGFPNFVVSEGLGSLLSLTDCDLTPSDIKFPFPNFRVELPPGLIPVDDPDSSGSIEVIHFRLHYAPHNAIFNRQRTLGEWWGDIHTALRNNDPGQEIVSLLCLSGNIVYRNTVPANTTDWRDLEFYWEEMSELEKNAARAAWKLLFNLASYIGAHKEEVDKAERRQKEVKEGAKRKWKPGPPVFSKIWELGRDIKISPQIREAAVASNRNEGGYRLSKRLMVRGYWRSQPYGPKMSLRRQQWVQPYWKGPEDGIGTIRGYKVEG